MLLLEPYSKRFYALARIWRSKTMHKPWRKVVILGITAFVIYSLSLLVPSYPHIVERVYARGIYPVWAQITSSITGLLPISLSEILLLIGPRDG